MENLEVAQSRNLFGLSKEERKKIEVEESLETLSRYLDGLFTIPGIGWKFGLDSIVGLFPGIGDTATSLVSFYILIAGVRYGVPKITLARMALNIAIDYVVGVIPFVGDAFDFVWKSNKKNMDLLRTRATGKGNDTTSDWIFVSLIILFLIGLLVGSFLLTFFVIGSTVWQIFSLIF